jgi:hypothetical protein
LARAVVPTWSRGIRVLDVNITAERKVLKKHETDPFRTPNTDGIEPMWTRDVTIRGCRIKNGDDCITVKSGSSDVLVEDLYCEHGDGLTIGSVWYDNVVNVTYRRVVMNNTHNGPMIKGRSQGNATVRDILFEDIRVYDVYLGLTIDCVYETSGSVAENIGVRAVNITFRNVSGSVTARRPTRGGLEAGLGGDPSMIVDAAGSFTCLPARKCSVSLDDVHFWHSAENVTPLVWACNSSEIVASDVTPKFPEACMTSEGDMIKTDDNGVAARGDPQTCDDPTLICSSSWPSTLPRFHLLNNVSRDASGKLSVRMQSGDANGIFYFAGLFHAMNQAGGNWGHAVSNDLVHWYHVQGLLGNGVKGFQPCDGTVSFPDLGEAPFNGSTPIIMYGPNCGTPVKPPNGYTSGLRSTDAPRVGTARAAVPVSPYLFDFVKPKQEAVTFQGIPCSFPGRVWKSKRGPYWNLLCAEAAAWPAGGTGKPLRWAKYTTTNPDLLNWKVDPKPFAQTPDGKPAGVYPCSGPYFHRMPGAPVGGPTHIMQSGCDGDSFGLGTYDSKTEVMTVTSHAQTDVPSLGVWGQKMAYHWGAAGREAPDTDPDTDSGRLFTFAWIASDGLTWLQSPSTMSLIRELKYDAAVGMTSFPVEEYATKLRNATVIDEKSSMLASGAKRTLALPHGAGGMLDFLVSFAVNSSATGGFGVAVRAPPGATAGAALIVTVQSISKADAAGTRNATIVFSPAGSSVVRLTPTNETYIAAKTVPVLAGESLDLRILIDRPVIEAFVNGGRTSYVTADTAYSDDNSSVHIFAGASSVAIESVEAHTVGCGWSETLPKPRTNTISKTDDTSAAATPTYSDIGVGFCTNPKDVPLRHHWGEARLPVGQGRLRGTLHCNGVVHWVHDADAGSRSIDVPAHRDDQAKRERNLDDSASRPWSYSCFFPNPLIQYAVLPLKICPKPGKSWAKYSTRRFGTRVIEHFKMNVRLLRFPLYRCTDRVMQFVRVYTCTRRMY